MAEKEDAGQSIGVTPAHGSDFDADSVVRALANYETELLNSDEIFVAGEVFAHLVDIVPSGMEFDLFFRERRRFAAEGTNLDPGWLFFPYLSFSLSNGELAQFETPEGVREALESRRSSGQYTLLEQTKFILCIPHPAPAHTERIAKRCAKLVTAFYYASGPHDHFTANIARRHMTTYLAEHYTKDPEELVIYIETQYGVQVAYLFQTSKDGSYETVVDRSSLLGELNQYDEFRRDLHNAVRRKASFLGMTADFAWRYSIHSLVDEASDLSLVGPETGRHARLLRRGCVILGKKDGRLPLDIIKVVPLLFDAHRSATRAKDRANFFSEVQNSGHVLEDEFAAAPPQAIEAFRGQVWKALAKPLHQLLSQDMMDWCQVFLADPFLPRLQSVLLRNATGEMGSDGEEYFDFDRDKEVPWVRAFSENRIVHVPNVETDPVLGSPDCPPHKWGATFDSRTKSLFAAPLVVGRLRIGSVVVGSKWPHLFEAEIPYLGAVVAGV